MTPNSFENSSLDGPLRIAFFSPALPASGQTGGIITYTRIMRDALRALGHSVTVVTLDEIELPDGQISEVPSTGRLRYAFQRITEARQPGGGSNAWVRLKISNAFRAACRTGAQVFEMEESFGWGAQLVGRGLAIVERLHGPHGIIRNYFDTSIDEKHGESREAAEVDAFRRVQAITCPTKGLLREVVEKYDLELPIARAFPNPMPLATPELSWRIDGADADQILFVGRFDLCKGGDVAVRAFAAALHDRPTLKLTMVGPDAGLAQPDGRYRHFAEYIAAELPPEARSRISFLGARSPEEISSMRLQAGFALVPSRFETFSYTIAEAMAAGMPVLTSDTFGAREMLRTGVDGEIVPVDDVPALAKAMALMASNPTRLAGMGRSARAQAASLLSPERIATESANVYREAIGRMRS